MKIDTLVNFAGGLCLCTALLLTGCTQVPRAEVAEEKTATGETAKSNGGTSNEGAAGLTLSAPNMEGLADTDIGLLARIHYATHTPDFDRARTFYRALGYTEGVPVFR